MVTRRDFVVGTALASGALLTTKLAAQKSGKDPARLIKKSSKRITVPNGHIIQGHSVDGVKVFHLIAEEIRDHKFMDNLTAHVLGYNGVSPGPVIEVTQGDRCRFYVTNKLTEPTSVHWHGIILPNGMDGFSGLTQKPIKSGETFVYEFDFPDAGTFMYHPHYDEMTQMALGLMGMIVVHPRREVTKVDRDFVMILSEWNIKPGTKRPDPMEMIDFNTLTINHRVYPNTEPLVAKTGDKIRIRIGNLSPMDNHPIHLHGYAFRITETDGGRIPKSAQWPETTVLMPTGSTRTIEFVADNPGDWAMHCHMTHHGMNQMGHGLPNMYGADVRGLRKSVRRFVPGYMPMGQTGMGNMGRMAERMPIPKNTVPMRGKEGPFGYIDMGGMFTLLKVRDSLTSYADPGDYDAPAGTRARLATSEELQRDGIL